MNNSYDGYEDWKNWNEFGACSFEQAFYFDSEIGCYLQGHDNVLEIGFGSGAFLAWAAKKELNVLGTEVNPNLTAKAVEAGYKVVNADLTEMKKTHLNFFDLIIAFDVFEHLSIDDVREHLALTHGLLKVGGKLILRFPNGQSPFGMICQGGDPTHMSVLSISSINALIVNSGFSMLRGQGVARIGSKGSLRNINRWLRYRLRDGLSIFLNWLFATRICWDPVVTVVLEKG